MASSIALNPQTFAKLTPHPFLLANLQQQQQQPPSASGDSSSSSSASPARTNGRAPREPRPLHVNGASLSHAHGSAMVRIGDTSVICGVRGEILPATSIPQWRAPEPRVERDDHQPGSGPAGEGDEGAARELRDYDLLVPNIELATGCAPQFLPGQPPSSLAQTLSTRVYTLLHNARLLDAEDLRVWYQPPTAGADEDAGAEPELKAYWTLYIDVLFVSFDGNPFDAAWVAILAALRDTKLPAAWWDADREMVLCSRKESRPLTVTGLPVACTASVLTEKESEGPAHGDGQGKIWSLVDPDREEEKLCDESVTVVVDRSSGETRIRGISKAGGRTLGPKEIREMVGVAESRWEDASKELLK